MGRKPKFKPMITRIKLNPEQAVLSCNCYSNGNLVKIYSLPSHWSHLIDGGGFACTSGGVPRTSRHLAGSSEMICIHAFDNSTSGSS